MKKCKNVSGWTDYPFTQLGDIPNTVAPIRKVEVLSYDGDKRAKIIVEGIKTEIKAGYLYGQPGRFGQVKQINRRKLERMIPNLSALHL